MVGRWEHDVDIYVPAKEASAIITRLQASYRRRPLFITATALKEQCSGDDPSRWTSKWCATLWYRGQVERVTLPLAILPPLTPVMTFNMLSRTAKHPAVASGHPPQLRRDVVTLACTPGINSIIAPKASVSWMSSS